MVWCRERFCATSHSFLLSFAASETSSSSKQAQSGGWVSCRSSFVQQPELNLQTKQPFKADTPTTLTHMHSKHIHTHMIAHTHTHTHTHTHLSKSSATSVSFLQTSRAERKSWDSSQSCETAFHTLSTLRMFQNNSGALSGLHVCACTHVYTRTPTHTQIHIYPHKFSLCCWPSVRGQDETGHAPCSVGD